MIQIYLNVIETSEQRSIFEIIYYEYRDMLFAYARSILNDTQLAEDAVHTAFARVAERFAKIENKLIPPEKRGLIISYKKIKDFCPKIGAYLVIVVRNVCYDMLNKNQRLETVYTDKEDVLDSISDIHEMPDMTDDYADNITVESICEAIRGLSPAYRDVLYMYVVLEMDAWEISEALGCSYENARKRIQRGRKKLREILSSE